MDPHLYCTHPFAKVELLRPRPHKVIGPRLQRAARSSKRPWKRPWQRTTCWDESRDGFSPNYVELENGMSHDVSKMKGRYFGCENKKKWNHHRLVIQCSQAIIFKDVQPMSLPFWCPRHIVPLNLTKLKLKLKILNELIMTSLSSSVGMRLRLIFCWYQLNVFHKDQKELPNTEHRHIQK